MFALRLDPLVYKLFFFCQNRKKQILSVCFFYSYSKICSFRFSHNFTVLSSIDKLSTLTKPEFGISCLAMKGQSFYTI